MTSGSTFPSTNAVLGQFNGCRYVYVVRPTCNGLPASLLTSQEHDYLPNRKVDAYNPLQMEVSTNVLEACMTRSKKIIVLLPKLRPPIKPKIALGTFGEKAVPCHCDRQFNTDKLSGH
jgi:hypothetical protein